MTKNEFYKKYAKPFGGTKFCDYCKQDIESGLHIFNETSKSNDALSSGARYYYICETCWENLDREAKKDIFRQVFKANAILKTKCSCCNNKTIRFIDIGLPEDKSRVCPKCFANTGEQITSSNDTDFVDENATYLIIDCNQSNIAYEHFNYYLASYYEQQGVPYAFENVLEYFKYYGFFEVMNVTKDQIATLEQVKALLDSYGISSYIMDSQAYSNYLNQLSQQKPEAIYFADTNIPLK